MGGSEIAIFEIGRRLREINFHIITHRFWERLLKEESDGNLQISRVGFGWSKFALPLTGVNRALLDSPAFKENNQRPIIHAYQASYGGGAAWIYKKLFPKSVFILTLQEGKDLSGKSLITYFRNLIIKKADVITAISKYLADYARKINPKAKIVIIPNGVDIGNFSRNFSYGEMTALDKKLGLMADDKVIISASRIVPKNGLDLLIKAIAILNKNKEKKIKLIIAGNHPIFDQSRIKKLKKLAEELGMENNVIFAGIVSHTDLPLYLKISDVFVRPSRSEGLGSAFLEAMAAGVPIVGTKVGGIPDFLEDRKTGLFCTQDSEDIAFKIRIILENDKLREEMANRALSLATERYDWDIIAVEFGKLYKSF